MPTVFAVRDGALVDHIVGMPRSAEELQRFVLRAMSEDGATGTEFSFTLELDSNATAPPSTHPTPEVKPKRGPTSHPFI